jgi:DNA-damage-inducible protein J
MATKMIHARIDDELKTDVETVFQHLGLTTTEAIKLFFHQVRLRGGLPFQVEIPNEETLKTFRDTDAGVDMTEHKDPQEMFRHLRALCSE